MWKKPDCVDRSLPLSIPVPVSDCGGEFKPPLEARARSPPSRCRPPFSFDPRHSLSLSVARSLPRADGRQVSKHCRQACVTKQITHTRAFKKKNKDTTWTWSVWTTENLNPSVASTLIGRLFHGTVLGSWLQQTLIEPRRALINSSQRCRDGLLRSGHRRGPSPPRQTGEKTFYGPLLWPRGHRHVGTGKGLP